MDDHPAPPPGDADEEARILAAVAAIARRHVGLRGELHRDQRLVEDLELDSIRALTLAVEVENHFRVAIDPETEARITTVGDLVGVIRGLLDDPV